MTDWGYIINIAEVKISKIKPSTLQNGELYKMG
jgi:hypothetical protein